MTDDLGYGIANYFAMELVESSDTPNGNYVEKYTSDHGFTVVYREQKYGGPAQTFNLSQERDADQIFLAAEEGDIEELINGVLE